MFRKWFDSRITAQFALQKKAITTGLICTGIAALLTTFQVPLIRYIIDSVENGRAFMLNYLSIAALLIFGIKYWFSRGQYYYLSKADIQLTNHLRKKLYEKLQKLPISYFNEKRAGAIQSVLTNDINVYHNAITSAKYSIEGPVKLLLGFAFILWIQWFLALIVLCAVPVFLFVIQRNRQRSKKAQDQVQADFSDMTSMMQESLLGIRIIKAFGAEKLITKQFDNNVDQCQQSQLKAARRMSTMKPTVELVGATVVAIAIFFCGQLVYRNALTVAQLTAFLLALDMINQGARSLGDLFQSFSIIQSANNRIHEQILDVPEPKDSNIDLRTLENPVGKIEFRNVSFTYPDGTIALNNVSFILKPGTSLALVGPSGAGKSTIADLVLRFYEPTSGQILFDDVDVNELNSLWLRKQIGVVPQQTFLFAGNISDNLKLGATDATEEDMKKAIIAAHAEPFIMQMPNQLATNIGERGISLSGGEAQRIAIARALIREPKLLILDEATSNLDAVSEKIVQEALEEIMVGRTSLFIAHRLSTAARANKILMLRKGEVIEQGSHKELLKQNGAYAGMYRAYSSGIYEEVLS